jgi:hypothetical protein
MIEHNEYKNNVAIIVYDIVVHIFYYRYASTTNRGIYYFCTHLPSVRFDIHIKYVS